MATSITLTDRAADRIRQIIAADPGKRHFRVSVLGGGCSGFQYDFALDDYKER